MSPMAGHSIESIEATHRSPSACRVGARLPTWLLMSLLVWCPMPAMAADVGKTPDRVIAVGDVHGSYEGLLTILRTTGLIDAQDRWSGGNAILVQTGDLTDRGANVRQVFDLLRRLQGEAAAAGGGVITLLGNHEIANLLTVFSPEYTEPAVFAEVVAAFADGKSEKKQREALRRHSRWSSRYPGCGTGDEDIWLAEHPPGTMEYIEALSPRGRYGEWLRSFPAVAKIGDTVFLHGGLSPALEEMGFDTVDGINARVAEELAAHDRVREWLERNRLVERGATLTEMLCAVDSELYKRTEGGPIGGGPESEFVAALRAVRASLPSAGWLTNHTDGPLWFRGYAHWSDEEGAAALPRLRDVFGVDHFVVGHTPQPGKINARFDGGVFLIDTGLVFGAAAGGGPAALEIRGGVFSALYPEEKVVLWDAESGSAVHPPPVEAEELRWKDPEGKWLPLASAEEVEEFLASARVVAVEDIPLGVTNPKRLLLERDGLRARAAFRYFHETSQRKDLESGTTVLKFRDSFRNEVAAYRLSQLLGLGRVPPAVLRTVDDTEGSVQIWVEEAMMEVDRLERDLEPPDALLFQRQNYDMRIFDNLIGNFDRNQGNILIDDQWQVWLIDHTRSFRAAKELPEAENVVRCSKPMWHALNDLEDGEIEDALADHLPQAELRAVLARRVQIVDILRARIDSLGETKVLFDWDDPNPDVRVIEAPIEPADAGAGTL